MENELFNKFVETLENMIDAQDDMWEEEKYENVHARRKIYEERFIPARDKLKEALDAYVDDRILKGLKEHGVTRTYTDSN